MPERLRVCGLRQHHRQHLPQLQQHHLQGLQLGQHQRMHFLPHQLPNIQQHLRLQHFNRVPLPGQQHYLHRLLGHRHPVHQLLLYRGCFCGLQLFAVRLHRLQQLRPVLHQPLGPVRKVQHQQLRYLLRVVAVLGLRQRLRSHCCWPVLHLPRDWLHNLSQPHILLGLRQWHRAKQRILQNLLPDLHLRWLYPSLPVKW